MVNTDDFPTLIGTKTEIKTEIGMFYRFYHSYMERVFQKSNLIPIKIKSDSYEHIEKSKLTPCKVRFPFECAYACYDDVLYLVVE